MIPPHKILKVAQSARQSFFDFLTKTDAGNRLMFSGRRVLGRLPVIDYGFPASISLETSGICNLGCIHCPSHHPYFALRAKKGELMPLSLFSRLMDEIDAHGTRILSLHKDGEPLLHPHIIGILDRVKKNQDHKVTLITNGHFLSAEIGQAILKSRIDIVLFSIGAGSRTFYEKVRGAGYVTVIDNIQRFLELRKYSAWKPAVIVQIICLPEYPEMKEEIRHFRKFWKNREVEVNVYDKLTWGILEAEPVKIKRYPCISLWRNIFINADGKASACCIDWDESLVIGDANRQTIAETWAGEKIRELRRIHREKNEDTLSLCRTCNYWSTVSRLSEYRTG
jgi:radical SAM protein with 4Fe4S-binding SPASM domain